MHEVSHVFTLCGGHISPILTSAEILDIKVVDVRDEATAVFAADAYGRMTNTPGVALVTAGPGVTNTITALQNAKMAGSPLILIGGASATLLKGRGSLQDIDQASIMRPVCKKVILCKRVKDLGRAVSDAFSEAMSYPRGPVFIEMPIDTLYPYKTVLEQGLGRPKANPTLMQRLVNMYVKFKIDRTFIGGMDTSACYVKKVPELYGVSDDNVWRVINMICQSQRPVMLMSDQVLQNPKCTEQSLKEIIDLLKIPCFLTGGSRGAYKGRHVFRHCRTEALRNADLVILLGVTCDFRLNYGKKINRRAKVIAVNHNESSLRLNNGLFWKSTISFNTDTYDFIRTVYEERMRDISRQSCHSHYYDECVEYTSGWVMRLRNLDESREREISDKCTEAVQEDGKVDPVKFLREISDKIPDDAIIVADGGDFVGTAAYILNPGYRGWLDPGPFGTLGVGAGFAIGAKVACPDRPVIILYGDGSCGYSLMEYDTFERHVLNITAIIGNDACWSQIAREQVPMLGSDTACRLNFTKYCNASHMFNHVKGVNVCSMEDVSRMEFDSDRPMIYNVNITKSNFREGSISV